MTGTITTKFSIGDTVWQAWTTTESFKHKCPDCNGSRKWKAISPAGNEYEFACPRCTFCYQSSDDLNLNYSQYVPVVHKLTIGSVRIDTSDDKHPVSYMCVETGVGSGTIHYEQALFHTEEEANVSAKVLAESQNIHTPWVSKRYDRTLDLCDYQLENALTKAARDARIHHQVKLGMLFEDLRDAENVANVKEIIEAFSFKEDE